MKLKLSYFLCALLFFSCKKDPVYYEVNLEQSNGGEAFVSESGPIEKGTSITFSSTPNENYQFVEWIDINTGQTYDQNPLIISLAEDLNISPVFEKIEFTLTINTIGNGNVTASKISSANKIEEVDELFESGDRVELQALPDQGHVFMNWNEAEIDTTSVKEITITDNQEITANFNYELARKLVGTWDIALDNEAAKSSPRYYSRMRVTIDYGMNCYFQSWNRTGQRFTYRSRVKFWGNNSCSLGNSIYMSNISFSQSNSLGCSFSTISNSSDEITSEGDIEVNQTIRVDLTKTEEDEVSYDGNGLISDEQPTLDGDIENPDIANALTEIISDTIDLPTMSNEDLAGNWNVKELYYLDQANEITQTFQIPFCAKQFMYHTISATGTITNQGIGINWPQNQCTSAPFEKNDSQITISSNGNQVVHYTNSIKRTWVILDKPDNNTLIIESFRNDLSDNYNGNDVGFKLVRENRYGILPPEITLNGSNTIYLNQGDNFVDPGATATDDFEGDLTSSITVSGSVDTSTTGTYTLTYSVSDAAGNSTTVNRTVIVNSASTRTIIADYRFEGDSQDSSGNANHGTNTGGVYTADRFGEAGKAIYFSGASCATRMDSNIDMSTVTDEFSISFWINRTGDGCQLPRVFDFYDGGNNSNDWGTAWANGNNKYQNLDEVSESDTWYHVVHNFNSDGGSTIYVDGQEVITTANSGKTLPLSGDFALGRMNHPAYDAFNGKLDDVKMYNYALSQSEVNALFDNYVNDTTAPTISLTGSATIELAVGDTFTDPGATASDDVDGNLTNSISVSGSVDTSTTGTYTLTYSVSDAAGNSTTVNRTVIVNSASTRTIIADYRFEGDSQDSSGNANHGTNTGGVYTADRFGEAGKAIYFSGASCATRMDSNIDMSTVTDEFSISFWINRTGDGCQLPRVFDFYDGGNNSNDWGTAWANGNNKYQNLDEVSESDTWYHVVHNFNSDGGSTIYVDGQEVITTANSGKTLPLSGDFALGRMNHPAYDAFNGKLDDVKMYNYALSQSEVNALFDNYVNDTTAPTISLTGSATIELAVGDTFTDPGATASDDVDGNLTNSISVSGSVDTSTTGTYTLTYTVSDAAGNSTTVNRIINVSVPLSLTDNYLNGTWDGIELYLYSAGTSNIENTYDVPTCGEPYTYLTINKTTGNISTQGIGINYPNGNCTSSEYPINTDSYTINSDGNSFEHNIGGSVIRKYEIVSKTDDQMIVKNYRNGSEEISYGKPIGFKWVRRN